MGCFKFFLIPLLIIATILGTVASFTRWGTAGIKHPQGINLRNESVRYRKRHGFIARSISTRSSTRSHSSGGGLSFGK